MERELFFKPTVRASDRYVLLSKTLKRQIDLNLNSRSVTGKYVDLLYDDRDDRYRVYGFDFYDKCSTVSVYSFCGVSAFNASKDLIDEFGLGSFNSYGVEKTDGGFILKKDGSGAVTYFGSKNYVVLSDDIDFGKYRYVVEGDSIRFIRCFGDGRFRLDTSGGSFALGLSKLGDIDMFRLYDYDTVKVVIDDSNKYFDIIKKNVTN